MVLVIDVGNTNTVIGLYEDDNLKHLWRLDSNGMRTSDEAGIFLVSLFSHWKVDIEKINDVVISSVVPNVMSTIIRCTHKYFNMDPMVVDINMKMNVKFNEGVKNEMGADRIVNAVASYKKYGGPIMNIDFGTATTYDVISEDGCFLTGITAPGIKISADALFSKTALLGKVELMKPENVVANNTIESIQSGIIYGHVGQTEYIINKLKEELGIKNLNVVATGGFSRMMGDITDLINIVDVDLTLDGIKYLYDLNKK